MLALQLGIRYPASKIQHDNKFDRPISHSQRCRGGLVASHRRFSLPTPPGDTDYGIIEFAFDPGGRLESTTDQAGDTITNNFDMAGRMYQRDYRTRANSPSGTIADSDTFTFDQVSRIMTAVSDRYNNKVTRTDSSGTEVYVQPGQQTIADYNHGAAPSSPNRLYVWGSYIDEPILHQRGTTIRYYHRKQQYSVVALTDESGEVVERYAYTAYGQLTIHAPDGTERTTTQEQNRYTYTGREWDPVTSTYHFRARHYDPALGRFISRDPLGYVDGMGLYGGYFVPRSVDPFGLWQVTFGAGYGPAFKITFGKNQGRWNVNAGLGMGVGLMGSFSPDDVEPGSASQGSSGNFGFELSGGARVGGVGVGFGARGRAEIDESNNIETVVGAFGDIQIPRTPIHFGGSADVGTRGNLSEGTVEIIFPPETSGPRTEIGIGGMAFFGAMAGIAWDEK